MDVPDSKYRGKCVIILIIDTGLVIFDMARTSYSIIFEFINSAAEAQRYHNQQISSLYKVNSGINKSSTPAPPSIFSKGKLNFGNQSSSATTSESDEIKGTEQLSSSTAAEIIFPPSKYKEPSESELLIIAYVVSIIIIIVQLWAVSTLWKACQPDLHPRLAAKCCRRYCNYCLFPRIPLVLFKWSVPGLIFALGEIKVLWIFALIYCGLGFRWAGRLGKELIEVTIHSAGVSVALAAGARQNNSYRPSVTANAHAGTNAAGTGTTSTPNPDGNASVSTLVGGASMMTLTGAGFSVMELDDEEEAVCRRPAHEIPKHERIGFKVLK